METASRLQEHTFDRINPYLYCAMLYQWKIPVFSVIFMQSLDYIICIVSNEIQIEHDPD